MDNRNKIPKRLLVLLVLIFAGLAWIYDKRNAIDPRDYPRTDSSSQNQIIPETKPENKSLFDPKNSTFSIDNNSIQLNDGYSEISLTSIPEAKIYTRYFGNESKADLNGDGIHDFAYIVTQDGGGSGTFYYLVVALSEKDGYRTINPILIGDRIAPQSTIITEDKQIEVNFADRNIDEPMSFAPTIGKTIKARVNVEEKLEKINE